MYQNRHFIPNFWAQKRLSTYHCCSTALNVIPRPVTLNPTPPLERYVIYELNYFLVISRNWAMQVSRCLFSRIACWTGASRASQNCWLLLCLPSPLIWRSIFYINSIITMWLTSFTSMMFHAPPLCSFYFPRNIPIHVRRGGHLLHLTAF